MQVQERAPGDMVELKKDVSCCCMLETFYNKAPVLFLNVTKHVDINVFFCKNIYANITCF